jgi:hypothetical protein
MADFRSVASSALGVAGAAVSGVAGVCCTIPALSSAIVAVLGVGGSVMLAELAPYRPWILGGSALMLGFSTYRAFARPCARAARVVSVAGIALWLFAVSVFFVIP